MSYTLKIGGVTMPTPARDGITVNKEPIWSKNTGRSNNNGKMLGTIVAIKTTVEITFPPLTPAQVATIDAQVSDKAHPFKSLTYTDADGTTKTITVYFGTPTRPIKGYINGKLTTIGYKVSAIEQ